MPQTIPRSGSIPDLLARLYQPFTWDGQGEHAPDAPRVRRQPVFEYDGALAARYYEDYIVNGHRLAGTELDDEGREALAALRGIVDDPASWVEFRIEKGQLQYLHNRQFAHSRTAFTDAAAPDGKSGETFCVRTRFPSAPASVQMSGWVCHWRMVTSRSTG